MLINKLRVFVIFKFCKKYILKYKIQFFIYFILCLISSIISLYIPIITSKFIDNLTIVKSINILFECLTIIILLNVFTDLLINYIYIYTNKISFCIKYAGT